MTILSLAFIAWREQPFRGVEVEDHRGQCDRADYSDEVSCFHFLFPFSAGTPLHRTVLITLPRQGGNPANYFS